jgi:hypothetical protein
VDPNQLLSDLHLSQALVTIFFVSIADRRMRSWTHRGVELDISSIGIALDCQLPVSGPFRLNPSPEDQ